ncbi:ALP1-like protein [Tanacetum coccineum]
MKCTSVIRQMAYGAVPYSLDEYLQMGATTARDSLRIFYEKHGFPEMLGSIDCTDPFILLEAIAYQELWIWHAFFGVSGMNNDVNVLRQSPLFNDLKSGRAPDLPFVANNVPYKSGYYLTDGIYPQWVVLIKSIKNPGTNDHKQILYKTKHEAARKDVERAFGVLKKKWKLIKHPARGLSRRRLSDVMYTCIILHNMIIQDNGEAISLDFFREEQHRADDPVRTHEESMMTGPVIEGNSEDREETPPLTKEHIEWRISAFKPLIKDHNKKNTVDPLRLNFELEDTNADCSTIVKGKTAGDADLRKPFKEALRTPITRKIIEFAGPEYKMPTNIKLYDGTTDLEDHLNRINEWSELREAFAARYSVRKACFKEPHEITKIVWKANESLTAFKGRWTVETWFILGVPQVMKISSFMDSFKCHELVKRYSDKVPQTVEEMTVRLMTSFALKKLSLA